MSKARDGVEDLKTIDANLAAKAPLASPSFTGTVSIDSPNQASGGSALKIRQGNATSFGIDMGLSQVTGHLNISRVNSNTAAHMMTLARDTGNVGVGTASPAKPLDVTGDIRTSTGILFGTDTAAANTLDDYETGTWNPVVLNPNVSATHSGYYTKIGDTVHVIGIANLSNNAGSGVMSLAGLPFTANRFAGGVARESGATGVIYFAHTAASSTNIQINTEANGAVSWGSSRTYSFDFTYKTDS